MKKTNETKKILNEWRNFLLNENDISDGGNNNTNEPVPTIGDLKKFLNGRINNIKAKSALKILMQISGGAIISSTFGSIDSINEILSSLGSETIEQVINKKSESSKKLKDVFSKLSNSISNIKDKSSIIKKFIGFNGEQGFKGFMLDPETSIILDDKVENDFIKWLIKDIESKPDDLEISDFDCNDELNKYLKLKVNKKIENS